MMIRSSDVTTPNRTLKVVFCQEALSVGLNTDAAGKVDLEWKMKWPLFARLFFLFVQKNRPLERYQNCRVCQNGALVKGSLSYFKSVTSPAISLGFKGIFHRHDNSPSLEARTLPDIQMLTHSA